MGVSTFLILTIFVLELIAFGLGIGAEQRRAKGTVQHHNNVEYTWCAYSSDIATGLGFGAALFLLAGQLLISAATRCLCCGSSLKPGAARVFAIIFFFLNWISFLIAASCYMAGSVQNAKHIRYFQYFTGQTLTCEAIRKDTFAAGITFTFFTFILSISYYLCYVKARQGSSEWNRRGGGGDIGMTNY